MKACKKCPYAAVCLVKGFNGLFVELGKQASPSFVHEAYSWEEHRCMDRLIRQVMETLPLSCPELREERTLLFVVKTKERTIHRSRSVGRDEVLQDM